MEDESEPAVDVDVDVAVDVDGDAGAVEDLARAALAHARGLARTAPRRASRRRPRASGSGGPGSTGGTDATVRGPGSSAAQGGYSGAGPDRALDPQPLGSVFAGFAEDRGWERPIAQARVFAEWATLVGDDVAAHCTPQSLRDGELRIAAESTAWATQLRLLAGTLLASLVGQLGPDVVVRLVITGPTAPSWKHGAWSVRGSRGPRDTYG